MTDIEMTKLCAEAMGLYLLPAYPKGHLLYNPNHDRGGLMWSGEVDGQGCYFIQGGAYDPLHNDEQAMALVKKLGLTVDPAQDEPPFDWRVVVAIGGDWDNQAAGESDNLNRAIVQCVAKLQESRD